MERLQQILLAASSYIPKIGISDIIELLIMCLVLYRILVLIKHTRAWVFVKGILILLVMYALADFAGFNVIKLIFHSLFSVLAILMVVLFQQELKKMIGEIGKKGSFWKSGKKKEQFSLLSEKNMSSIVDAVKDMSAVNTGALILVERDIPLKEWSDTGISVNADISRQMLVQIFEKNTPLHDGAVIINNGIIESATCYLPLSKNEEINKSLGTRHRAGIGISEVTDALVIIVSEETGKISTVLNGKISHGITLDELRKTLIDIQHKEIDIKKSFNPAKNLNIKIVSAIATVILWTVLTNISDPIITRVISDVPIAIQNESAITNQGLTYHITSKETTDVEVKGNRSLIDNMNTNQVYAYADLNNLSVSNATEIVAWSSVHDIEVSPKTKMLNISVEDIKEVDYDINVETEGTLSSEDYINSITLDTPSVKISGPVTKVNVIGNVVATFNIRNASSDKKLEADIEVFDKNGKNITNELNLSVKKVTAEVDMYATKKVPITVSVQCYSDNGEITSYTYDINDITIAADNLLLDATNTIFMEVPITVDDDVETSEFVKIVNIADFLPDGIFLADKEHKLSINVGYERYAEMNITIPEDNIGLLNCNKKYDYSVEPLTVKVRGLKENLDSIELYAEANVEELEPGVHQVEVVINNRYVIGGYKALIIVDEGK